MNSDNTERTIKYAESELAKYFLAVTGEQAEIVLEAESNENTFDDGYVICVDGGKGTVRGKNPRSVLLGVYGMFYEIGCRFVRPGKDGDILVKKSKSDFTVHKTFIPKYRHRGVCSEGAISEENITDMVRWLPKVGMNAYFMQFSDGHLFFEKWYRHKGSSVLAPEPYSSADSARHYAAAADAVKECGLEFHAMGHGWTTEPFGYTTYGENVSREEDIKDEHRELFAEVNGKRGFFNMPGDTRLCYGKKESREKITDAITEYLKTHSEVDVLHFWLADSLNNHCECELCRNTLPSDFYVSMLNLLDKKLTAAGIKTKIVFLIYCDLLFAPQKERIENPDRFIMMYAPISRDFFHPLYTDANLNEKVDAPAYERNKNNHPKTGGEFLYYLKNWRETVKCDSFAFDYHLMTFPYGGDLSGTLISETLYEDMGSLWKAGLNGNVSCQLQRIFMPTGLPMYVMAKRLCGDDRSFDAIEEEYLSASFGKQHKRVGDLLHATAEFFGSKEMCTAGIKDTAGFVKRFGEKFSALKAETVFSDDDAAVDLSLKILEFFTIAMEKFLRVLYLKRSDKEYEKDKQALNRFLDENEIGYQPYVDMLFLKDGLQAWI